jgi:hypothetical protein
MGSNMGLSSQPVEGAGIEDKNEQPPNAERHISKIKHGKLLPEWVCGVCATKARQGSIPIVGAGCKGSIRTPEISRMHGHPVRILEAS